MSPVEKISIALPSEMVTIVRQVWRQALADKTPGVSAEDVLDRLERKYQSLRRNKR